MVLGIPIDPSKIPKQVLFSKPYLLIGGMIAQISLKK
jgi:hypothetical protein